MSDPSGVLSALLAQADGGDMIPGEPWVLYTIGIGVAIIGGFFLLVFLIMMMVWGNLWFQAYMTSSDVTLSSLIGMSIRQVNPRVIVLAKTMAAQSGLDINRKTGISTKRLEAHYMSEGNVMNVIQALIAAQRANIDLDFDKAAAIDLAGRDVLDAVRTSVQPKVIDCPDPVRSGKNTLSAIARDGVELRVRARVTVRTNLEQLIGGATEETIIARVGESIISSIGSAGEHKRVLENPDLISKAVLARGLDAQTAFEIVSIDIADVDVGERIGARLQVDQAEADTRVARARAEQKRAEAIAITQENRARVAENRAKLVLAEAAVPRAMAGAIKIGNLHGGIASAERDAEDDIDLGPTAFLSDEEQAADDKFRTESEARMRSLSHSSQPGGYPSSGGAGPAGGAGRPDAASSGGAPSGGGLPPETNHGSPGGSDEPVSPPMIPNLPPVQTEPLGDVAEADLSHHDADRERWIAEHGGGSSAPRESDEEPRS